MHEWYLLALELVVDKPHAAVLGDGDGVLGIANRGVALGVEGVDGNPVLGNVVKAVLECPVSEGIDLAHHTRQSADIPTSAI